MKKKFYIITILIISILCGTLLPACNEIEAGGKNNSADSMMPEDSGYSPEDVMTSNLNEFYKSYLEERMRKCNKYHGSSFRNTSEFTLEYSIFDGVDDQILKLNQGDILHIEIVVTSGQLAATIQNEDGSLIYKNENLETDSFDLEIVDSGLYKIIVTGHDTCGSVSFKKQ